MTTTIIIGNGIGMALDPEHFTLSTGLDSSWQSFSDSEQKIIALHDQCPNKEEKLELQHLTATACKKLSSFKSNNLKFLSEEGEEFPKIYQQFIYRAAKHFYEYPKSLPEPFIKNLCTYIKRDSPSHIATLNYDKLIYKSLIEKDFLKGYSGELVDGIHNITGIFEPESFLRLYTNSFGWYLHLHGSPIFKSQDDKIYKENITTELPDGYNDNGEHTHIVLNHTRYKADVISGSTLLSTYFDFFISALNESQNLIIIGYNGDDTHINFEIKKWVSTKIENNKDIAKKYIIEIVEWDKSEHDQAFWEEKLLPPKNPELISMRVKIKLKQLPNVLDYDFELSDF